MIAETTRQKENSSNRFSTENWLDCLPPHWEVRRLRTVVEMRVSNVDKHTNEDETPVRLCNYVDVYYNDRIDGKLPYMKATVSPVEADRFLLKLNDVVITKDSESWNDIAVPALVTDAPNDLICGYHLAILRPSDEIDGAYLTRVLQTPTIAHQFHVKAQGITRYGLTHDGILSASVPLPPPKEQADIVRYLDHADDLISRYISAKERLIALLEEQRQAVIHQTVTRGLDPDVSLTPSGIPSLGDVPAHWDIRRAKQTYRESDQRSLSGVEELMSVSHITGVTPRKQNVTMFLAQSNEGYKLCKPGDIVVNTMWAYMAALGVARQAGLVSPSYGVYRPKVASLVNPEYMDLLLRTNNYRVEYTRRSTGITASRLRLYPDTFLDIPFLSPPPDEQASIVKYLRLTTGKIDSAIDHTRRQITLMDEYRTRLIADVVTGQLDVRNATVELPS